MTFRYALSSEDKKARCIAMRFSRLIIKNLIHRPARSLLTVVGLAIAVAALVALVGVATGFERSFLDYYTRRGVDFVVQRAGSGTEALNGGLPQELGERIEKIAGVKQVVGRLVDAISFRNNGIFGVILNGWLIDSPLFDHITMLSGRRLVRGEKHAALVGRVLAANLGKQVGDEIELYEQPFQVIGIYESPTVFENGGVVMSLEELQGLMNRPGEVTGFAVIVDHPESESQLKRIQERIEGLQPNLKVSRPADFVHNLKQIQLSRAVAWMSSAIALIIGAIGMFNTMIMSVFERVNEIGLLRAIGWRRRRIVRMIIGEAILLSLGGAILGSVVGVVLVKVLSHMPSVAGLVEGKVAVSVIGQAFFVALTVGVVGALYPAIWSALQHPTAALRRK
jgi:putative ABC transport system permease protein